METLKATLSRTITGAQLRKVYDALEDEERPYDATVRAVKDKSALYLCAYAPKINPISRT